MGSDICRSFAGVVDSEPPLNVSRDASVEAAIRAQEHVNKPRLGGLWHAGLFHAENPGSWPGCLVSNAGTDELGSKRGFRGDDRYGCPFLLDFGSSAAWCEEKPFFFVGKFDFHQSSEINRIVAGESAQRHFLDSCDGFRGGESLFCQTVCQVVFLNG